MKLNEMKLDDLLYMNLHMLSKKLFNTIDYKEIKKEHFTLTEKVKIGSEWGWGDNGKYDRLPIYKFETTPISKNKYYKLKKAGKIVQRTVTTVAITYKDEYEKILSSKTKDKDAVAELAVLEKIKPVLEDGQLARTIEFTDEELPIVKGLFLLTTKPMLYIANISEDDVAEGGHNQYVQLVEEYAAKEDAEVVVICARVEEEVAELEEEEKQVFLEEMGIETSGLDILIQKAYHLLGLATYFTAGEQEVRAWTFRRGMKAPQCAGIIHSDFERGFIRAETVAYADLLEFGSMGAAKENGKVRQEGKEYIVQDGDVMLFRFNV